MSFIAQCYIIIFRGRCKIRIDDMNKSGSGKKVTMVKEALLQQIRLNNFTRGSMLPPERELPERFGASYMTIRKAVSELVSENYLERQPGVGTFVRKDISRNKLNGVIGILCPTWNSPEISDLMIHASYVAEQNGWHPKLFFCRFWEDKVMEDAWKSCDALIVVPPVTVSMMPEYQKRLFSSYEKPVIFIGVLANILGIDSVLGTPVESIKTALDKFKEAGHRKVAYIMQEINPGQGLPEELEASYWREWYEKENPGEKPDSMIYNVKVPPYIMPHQVIYDLLMKEGRNNIRFTGIVTNYSLVWGAMAALHDLGMKVPDDISIITMGDRQEACFYRPMINCVYKSLREHAEKALQAIEFRLKNPQAPPQCLLVESQYRAGDSLKKLI